MPSITTQTEGIDAAEAILSCGEGQISFEEVTVATGGAANYSPCTVVAKITASGKWTILAPAAADGSQNAAGVLVYACDATVADQKAVIVARLAEVADAGLVWPGGITGPQKAAAITALAGLNIMVRA